MATDNWMYVDLLMGEASETNGYQGSNQLGADRIGAIVVDDEYSADDSSRNLRNRPNCSGFNMMAVDNSVDFWGVYHVLR